MKNFNNRIKDSANSSVVSKKSGISLKPSLNSRKSIKSTKKNIGNADPSVEHQKLLFVKEDKINHLFSKIENSQKNAKEFQAIIAHLNKIVSNNQTEFSRMQQRSHELENRNTCLESKIEDLQKEIEKLGKKEKIAKEANDLLKKKNSELEVSAKKFEEQKKQGKVLKIRVKELTKEKEDFERNAITTVKDFESQVEKLKKELKTTENQKEAFEHKITELKEKLKNRKNYIKSKTGQKKPIRNPSVKKVSKAAVERLETE